MRKVCVLCWDLNSSRSDLRISPIFVITSQLALYCVGDCSFFFFFDIIICASTSTETASECAEEEESITVEQSIGANFMIDEDSNFTLSDIDIVPTSTCASSDYYYFYQSTDGQPLYLHSMNTRMLQAMYGSLDKSPQMITGKIVHKDSSSMSEALRKRLKYLQHLPICTQFEVVEVEFKQGVISPEVLAYFKGKFNDLSLMMVYFP